MSKFNVGEEILVKESGKLGVIKGREVVNTDGKHTKITYVVKLGEGFENWKAFSKKELSRKPRTDKTKLNKITKSFKAKDGYTVTVVGFTNTYVNDYSYNEENDTLKSLRAKRLRIGYAICNPKDTFDENVGERIALHRAKYTPFCDIASRFTGEFNEATVEALIDVKADYIVKNIDRFIQ